MIMVESLHDRYNASSRSYQFIDDKAYDRLLALLREVKAHHAELAIFTFGY